MRALLERHKAALIPAYWKLVTEDQQPAIRRFHAACTLAAFDPRSLHAERTQSSPHALREEPPGHSVRISWNDANFTTFIAEQLVTVSPEYIGQYKELLRPVAPQLVPALSDIFKDPARSELAKSLATSLLADYAAKDPDTLTEVMLAADAVSDKSLFPVLQQHQATAVKNLESVLDQRLEPDWKDAPLDPAWTEPSAAVRAQIESAHGLITERFAFCQNMPLSEFLGLAETLRASGFRPTRIRPWAVHHAERDGYIGAIWTRDSQRWRIDPHLSKTDVSGNGVDIRRAGDVNPLIGPNPVENPGTQVPGSPLLLSDIAPLPAADEFAEPQFIALWSEPGNAEEQRRVLLHVTAAELTAAQTTLTQQGFTTQITIAVRTDVGGQRRYTGIWSNQGAASELRPAYAGFELVAQPQWDVAVAPAANLADPLETFRQQLMQIEKLPAEKLDDPQIRQARAAAQYQLGNLELALADLDFVVGQAASLPPSVLQYRTLTLARLGRAAEAKESLEKYLATDAGASFKSYVQIQVSASLGEFEQASTTLESAVTASNQNPDDLYNVVCAAALSSQALSAKDAVQSQKFADRTFELLRQMVAQGYGDAEQLKSDADFASLHGDPRFIKLLSELEPPATYAALWQADEEFESKLLTAVPVENVLDQFKPLLAEGWRPFAIAVGSNVLLTLRREGEDSRTITAERDEYNPLCSLVLHRPLIPDPEKEQLALQQAAAATALLRLNAAEKVWPLFQDQPDPRLRSNVLHRLATHGVDPQSLITQLINDQASGGRQSPDVATELNPGVDTPGSPLSLSLPLAKQPAISRQRSLILGLGGP